MLKKRLVLKIFLSVFILYGLVGFFILPNIIKEQIVHNTQDILKRHVSVDSVSLNPYTFELGIHKLFIYGKKGERALAGVRDVTVNIDPFNLLMGEIKIKFIEVIRPFVTIHKDENGKFNFSDLLVSDDKTRNENNKTKAELPSFLLERFAVRHGKVNFIDETGSKVFEQTLKPINFTIRDFSTKQDHQNQISLHVEIDDGAYFEYQGKVNSIDPLRLQGEMQLHSGRLYTQWQYFQDVLGFIVADGSLDASMSYTADLSKQPMQIDINQYKLNMKRLRLQDLHTRENVLKLPEFTLEGSVDISAEKLKIDRMDIKGLFVKAVRNQEGEINWLNYLPAREAKVEEKEGNKTKSKWQVDIANIDIRTEKLSYEENYAPKSYIAELKKMNFRIRDITAKGNQASIKNFDTNISDISIRPVELEKKWIDLKNFYVQGSLSKAEDVNINLNSIDLDKLNVYGLLDKSGTVNFSLLSAKKQKNVQEPSAKIAPLVHWKVDTFKLRNSKIDFEDHFNAVEGMITLDNINLEVNDLRSQKDTWAKSKLSLRINKSGQLVVNSRVRHTPLKTTHELALKNLNLVSFQSYVDKKANLDINSGRFNFDFTAKNNGKKANVIANTQIYDLNLSERREGKPFFTFSKLLIKDIDFSLDPDQMKIKKVDIYKPYARMKVDENKTTNLSDLMVPVSNTTVVQKVQEKDKAKKPFSVLISQVNFKDGKGEFSDLSLPLPFKTDIHGLNGKIVALGNIADVKSAVDIDGVIDEYGLAKIKGKLLSANPKQFTNMGIKFQNIDMTNFSPYSGKFIGSTLEKGKMNVELEYKVNNSEMKGGNRIVLKQLTLGEDVESEDAISAPVGLAIALLKDSEGVIDLDVPVSGNVDEPDFAIGHVVWTAFKNLIVGVATAPFRFLGDMLGISAEELENVNFEEGKANLLPPEREKMDKLSTVLVSKEMLVLKLAGSYDEKRDSLAMKTDMLYKEALSKLEDNTTDISRMDKDDLDDLLKDMYIEHFGKEKLNTIEDVMDDRDLETKVKKDLLRVQIENDLKEDQKVSQDDLIKLAQKRAEGIRNYLITKGVESDKLELLPSVEIEINAEESEYIPIKLELGAK